MAYLALYRKYRPTTFQTLIGQEHIVKTLINQINGEKLGHAYLFTGTRGTGKTSAAKIFAKAINCLNPVDGSPCGECDACRALADPSNIDVVEIDAASNNGVNEIRDLREKVQYPPVSCRYKVYIVDEVHMLTGAAFNALLKTLEEPPKHAVFILATTEVHKIPATILSRCMRFDFRLIPTERIASLISEIYDQQGKAYDKEAVFAIAKAGEGSIRDALSIADIALSYGTGKLTYDDVMEILGSSNSETLIEFVENILNSDSGKVLSTIDKLASLGKSMGVLTKDVTSTIRDLLVVKTCDNSNSILGLPESKFALYEGIAATVSEERLLRILEIFSDAENSLKYTNHPRVIFEAAAIKAARPDADYNIEALMSRIKALEDKVKEGIKVVSGQPEIKKEFVSNVEPVKTETVEVNVEKMK
ncbi:MAG: DNA polymerase III subunit gamma/tau, partial [Clostridia bacterium]|nr:DNA polymerase III subunit gamma/tau [Clostridia bacterium]